MSGSIAPVFVAGHTGLAGSAICRRLRSTGIEVLSVPRSALDLRDAAATLAWLRAQQPASVVLAAATVGGIVANASRPADFIADNLAIQQSVIMGAFQAGVQQLLFLGSSCIYPRLAAQPITEEALLTGPLEPTNAAYAIAKIAGIKLCEALRQQHGVDYRALMPTNLYGPGDNFHPEHSHVLAALLRRFTEAKASGSASVTLWGSGTPRREFLHVDDLADACAFVLSMPRAQWETVTAADRGYVNVGCGADLSIAELAALIARCVGYCGQVGYDHSRPDGTPRKLLDVSRLAGLGWTAQTGLEDGIRQTLAWLQAHPAA